MTINRAAHIHACLNGEKRPLGAWLKKIPDIAVSEELLQRMRHEYPITRDITKWEATYALARWSGAKPPEDPLDHEVEVELTLRAKVKVTAAVRQGVMEQTCNPHFDPKQVFDDEYVASLMLYASINPRLPNHNKDVDDYWDGVENLRGLITNIELQDDF